MINAKTISHAFPLSNTNYCDFIQINHKEHTCYYKLLELFPSVISGIMKYPSRTINDFS